MRVTDWEKLFDQAVALINSCTIAGIHLPSWRFGGSTLLMLDFYHRHSQDIGTFITDPQYLTFFSPRPNDTAASFSTEYIETAHSLKIETKAGDIDFEISPTLTAALIEQRIICAQAPILINRLV